MLEWGVSAAWQRAHAAGMGWMAGEMPHGIFPDSWTMGGTLKKNGSLGAKLAEMRSILKSFAAFMEWVSGLGQCPSTAGQKVHCIACAHAVFGAKSQQFALSRAAYRVQRAQRNQRARRKPPEK